jgi:Holliday junction resolvase
MLRITNTISRITVCSFIAITAWLAGGQTVVAQKTDIITLRNGDVITGEIKNLKRGKLELSTSKIGTILIEWKEIARVDGGLTYQVELVNLDEIVITLRKSEEDNVLAVVRNGQNQTLPMSSVTEMIQLKGSFWTRLKASVQIGANIVKANDERQYNSDATLSFRTRKWYSTAAVSSYASSQAERETSRRNNASYDVNRLFKQGWGIGANAGVEASDELNLDSRILFGISASKSIIQNSSVILDGLIGVQTNSEDFSTAEEVTNSAEGVVTVSFEHYKFRDPEIDFTMSASAFPSITESGRIRANINAKLAYEILPDVDIGINGFYDYDSDPPPGSSRNDYGVFTSIGVSFN